MRLLRKKKLLTAEAAQSLYPMLFGRPAESPKHGAIMAGKRVQIALANHVSSDEFRWQTVRALITGKHIQHSRLGPKKLEQIATTLNKFFGVSKRRLKQAKLENGRYDAINLLLVTIETPLIYNAIAAHYGLNPTRQILNSARALGKLSNTPLKFHLDGITNMRVHGYVLDEQTLQGGHTLGFFINEKLVSMCRADRLRRDVQDLYGGDGLFGFEHEIKLPPHMLQGSPINLSIVEMQTNTYILRDHKMLVDTIDKIGYLQRLTNTLDALAEKVPQSTADVDALIGLIKQAQASMPRVSRVMSAPLENYDILSSQVARALPPTIAADKCLHIIALQGAQRYQNLPDCITQHTVGPDIDASVNAIVKAARDEDLILFVHQDDRLKLDQLGWFFDSAKQNPEKSVFLSDFEEEDLPVMHGIFDPDHFLAANPYRHCFAVRATALKRNLQNFIEDGKQLDVEDWSFRQLLKLLDREGEARFSTIQRMVWETNKRSVISADQPIREWTFTNDPTPELVSNYIASKGHKVAVEPLKDNFSGSLPYARSIRYQAPADDKLAVIIPTRNALEITRACVESLMATAADVALLDIMIVNNQSDDEATLAWFEDVTKHPAVRVIDYDDKFNWSAINNEAVKQTDADKLLFLNNDTLALSQDWDLITRGELEREDVGIVGARLLYEDGSIQHGGIILYDVGVATHDGIASWPSKGGYYNRTKVRHASAGATGAYLAVRRDVFDAVEGFDAENLRITFNDIDFGLKVMRADKKILYLPDITFHHLESKTRGFDYADEKKRERALKEKEWMEQKWRGTLRHDPYYPPAFLRQGRPFGFLDARSKKW